MIPGSGPYPVRVVRNVRLPMRDGITLAADLYMPEGGEGERFPAILEYTPYHKTHNAAYGPRATRYPYFASHGYVFVNVDIRGLGDSEGANTSPTSPEEVADLLEVIRWCATQPWSEASVGMIGISYTAGVCYDAARAAPDALKAIIVCQMCSDWYQGVVAPGGSPRPFILENYAPLMAAYQFAPPDPAVVGDEWERIWQQRLEGSRPWGLAYTENLRDGEFWDARLLRGREEQVKAATFLIGGWCDWYPDDMLRVFSRLKCPKRAIIGPWTHNYPENAWPLPRINDRWECLRWFDRYLKGKDTDPDRPVESEAPISLFVREREEPAVLRREDNGYWRGERVWPPHSEVPRTLCLNADGKMYSDLPPSASMAFEADPAAGIAAGRYAIGQMLPGWGMAGDQRLEEPHSLAFSSLEIKGHNSLAYPVSNLVGCPEVVLFLSASAESAFLSVKLCEVQPDGTSVLITKGALNLSHRDSGLNPEPLEPDAIYEVRVRMQATAYRLVGGRLRLLISSADSQNYWPTASPHTLKLYVGRNRPSRLEFSLSGDATSIPASEFRESDFMPPVPPEEMNLPEYSVTHDLIADALETRIVTKSGCGVNRSRYRIHRLDPANAVIESEYEYPLERESFSALVKSRCVTQSDETTMSHEVAVEITLNGKPYWAKEWSTRVPRKHF